MAIVVNAARPSEAVDKSFVTWNRKNAGAPSTSLTPVFTGEIVLDTTNNTYWRAVGIANTDWVAVTPRV